MALVITFSGTDGAGKSTQIKLLAEVLSKKGRKWVCFWSRGGYTPLFTLAKSMARRLRGRKTPAAGPSKERAQQFESKKIRCIWLILAILDLILCYSVWLRWKSLIGYTVICDRYLEDTLLDFNRNFPMESVERWWLWRLLCKVAAKPSCRFLLLVPPEESQRRSKLKNEPFPDTAETLEWRYARYQKLATKRDWVALDCLESPEEVHYDIMKKIISRCG